MFINKGGFGIHKGYNSEIGYFGSLVEINLRKYLRGLIPNGKYGLRTVFTLEQKNLK
jgi:hypothetical protein